MEWIFEIIFCILSSCHVLVPAFLFCNLGFLDYRYIVFSSLFCCTKIPENGFSTTTYSKHIQFSKFESFKKQVDQADDASDLCVQTQNFDPDQCNECSRRDLTIFFHHILQFVMGAWQLEDQFKSLFTPLKTFVSPSNRCAVVFRPAQVVPAWL